MSDQNLEYQLEVLVDDADKRMKALFASWDKIGKEAAKSYGKGLADSAREAKKEADQAARAYSDLDKAVTRAEKSADSLVRKYAGLSPEIDKAIGKLRQLVDTNKNTPEVTRIREAREATPAGKMNLESQQIQEQIRASVALAQLRSREQAELERHQQWVEKKNAQMNKGLAQLAESRTSKEEMEQYKRIKINSQVMEYEEQQRQKSQEQVSKHQQWVENLNSRMNKGVTQLNTKKNQQEQDEQYKRIRINSQVMEYEEQQRQKDQQSQEKHQQWVESLNSKMNKGMIQLAADKIKAQENAAAQQQVLREKELQAIQNAATREEAAEKQREQAAINRYKVSEEAKEKRLQAAQTAEQAEARVYKQQNALADSVDKADKGLKQQAQTLRDLGNTGAADQLERIRKELQEAAKVDLKNIGDKGTLLPTRNVDDLMRTNKLIVEGADEEIKKLQQVAKTSAQSHADRIDQAKKLNDAELKIRQEDYQNDKAYQLAIKAQHEQTAKFLQDLAVRSAGMTKAQIEAEISAHMRLASAKMAGAAKGAQAEVNAQFARITAMNKYAMAAYAVQQAVEDYSYAGMKGAMNNLSFLAMMTGGTTALAGLFAALTLNIASTSGALDGLAESFGLVLDKSKELVDQLKKYEENISRIKGLEADSKKEMIHFNPAEADINKLKEKAAATKNDINLLQEQANAAAGAEAAYREMLKIAKELGGNAKISEMDFGIRTETPETILNNIDAVRKYGQFMFEDAEAADKFYNSLERLQQLEQQMVNAGYSPSAEGFDRATKKSKAFNDSLDETKKTLEDINKQAALVGAMPITTKDLKELADYKFKATGESYSGMAGKNLSTAISDQQSYYKSREVELAHELAMAIEEAAGSEEKKLAAIQQYVYYMNLEKAWGKETVKNAEANASAQEKTTKALETREIATKKEIADSERLLEISEKHLQNIQEQKSAWQDAEAKRKAAALDRIDDLKHTENKESINKELKTKLEQAKDYKQYLDAVSKQNLENMKLSNEHGKGDYNPDHILQQQYEKWKYYNDQEYEEFVKKEKAKAQARIDADEKAINTEKQKRLDQLKEDLGGKAQDTAARAAQLQAEGKWEQAKSELEKSMKALKELHEAQQKAVGKTTSDQSKKAEKEMEATSKKIEKLFDDMAKLEDQQQQKIKKDIEDQKVALKDIIDLKAQAASINMTNPADIARLAAIEAALARILALMQQIQGTQMVGTSRVAGGPISPNQPPLVTPPAAPPTAPPPVPANQLPPAGGGLPSIPYDGRELPPLPPSTPEQRAMEEQERATAEHWAKQKEMRDKAALDERVAAAEEQRMAKANQNARKQQQDEEIAARHKFMDELDKESPAERLKRLKEEDADAWKDYGKSDSSKERWHKAYDAMKKEEELQALAKKSLKEKRELNDEDMKFAEEIKKQDDLVQKELENKGWTGKVGPNAQKIREEYGFMGSGGEKQVIEAERRKKLDDARRKAGLPREDWKKQDYEEAVKAEKRIQNIQKQTAAEQAGIGAVTQAKQKAESVNLVDPNEISTVEGVNSQLERTLALVQSIAAAGSIGSGMGGGGGAGGGRGGGGGSIANNITINTSAASSSVLSASLAASAAAQSLLIMRR